MKKSSKISDGDCGIGTVGPIAEVNGRRRILVSVLDQLMDEGWSIVDSESELSSCFCVSVCVYVSVYVCTCAYSCQCV